MNDPAIRRILRNTELKTYLNDNHSKVVEELKLPVLRARIDIAVINGHFHAYEIKSAQDTLQRLPAQIDAYSKIFDYVTVVTELKYHERIIRLLPEWIGVAVCNNDGGFEVVQPPVLNTNQQGFHIAKLLWHSELEELLEDQQIPYKKRARSWLHCQNLAENLDVNDLSALVREKLKQRKEWKIKEDDATGSHGDFD